MADIADHANDYTDLMLENALANRPKFEGTSEPFCVDCEEEIPEPRRTALPGVTRCVYCQQLQEV